MLYIYYNNIELLIYIELKKGRHRICVYLLCILMKENNIHVIDLTLNYKYSSERKHVPNIHNNDTIQLYDYLDEN